MRIKGLVAFNDSPLLPFVFLNDRKIANGYLVNWSLLNNNFPDKRREDPPFTSWLSEIFYIHWGINLLQTSCHYLHVLLTSLRLELQNIYLIAFQVSRSFYFDEAHFRLREMRINLFAPHREGNRITQFQLAENGPFEGEPFAGVKITWWFPWTGFVGIDLLNRVYIFLNIISS